MVCRRILIKMNRNLRRSFFDRQSGVIQKMQSSWSYVWACTDLFNVLSSKFSVYIRMEPYICRNLSFFKNCSCRTRNWPSRPLKKSMPQKTDQNEQNTAALLQMAASRRRRNIKTEIYIFPIPSPYRNPSGKRFEGHKSLRIHWKICMLIFRPKTKKRQPEKFDRRIFIGGILTSITKRIRCSGFTARDRNETDQQLQIFTPA